MYGLTNHMSPRAVRVIIAKSDPPFISVISQVEPPVTGTWQQGRLFI